MTNEQKIAPYGSWESPITADLITSETIGLSQITLDGEDVYWIESRPTEGGRNVVVKQTPNGQTTDIIPPPFNARNRVHEYGGGAFAVHDGSVFFSNFNDNRLYRQDPGTEPKPITPEAEMRYADFVVDHNHDRILCIREDHTPVNREAVNTITAVSCDGSGKESVLVSGNDFYSNPRLSPDGSILAWLTWNHPNMPWDGTTLWMAEVKPDGSLGGKEKVAGSTNESIFQPEWSPDGVLYFISDQSGWWNLYRLKEGKIEPLILMEAEFGTTQWVFGMSTYAFESAGSIICTYRQHGNWHLAHINTVTRRFEAIETPYTSFASLKALDGRIVFTAGSPIESTAIVQLDPVTRRLIVLRHSSNITIDSGYISPAQAIEFPTEHDLSAHAFFYKPENRDFKAPIGELPPLIVKSHGGPTGATSSTLSLPIQYWTSRGIAVLDVNYGGSVGYGREYRERLDGQWGVVDIDDCINGAKYLIKRGEVDGDRVTIRGGSAGGYTTLSALAFRDFFKAGASYFGVSDLENFVVETHKYESRYLERLIGPFPEKRALYRERSPVNYIDNISCPMILFQGLEDKVVPPNQAEMIYNALRKKGLPVAYIPFEGEQHGFRKAKNIKRSLEAELYFYSRVFGFELAEPVQPVEIVNR